MQNFSSFEFEMADIKAEGVWTLVLVISTLKGSGHDHKTFNMLSGIPLYDEK